MTTTPERLPHPCARRVIRDALTPYQLGLSMSELRRRTSRSGVILVVDAEGRNAAENFDQTLDYLVTEQLVRQALVGSSVRYIDAVSYPAPTINIVTLEHPTS